jgi:hypothetical protein
MSLSLLKLAARKVLSQNSVGTAGDAGLTAQQVVNWSDGGAAGRWAMGRPSETNSTTAFGDFGSRYG